MPNFKFDNNHSMKPQIILLIIFFTCCSSNNTLKKHLVIQQEIEQKQEVKTNDWIFEKTDSSKLVFKNGRIIETKLFDLGFIGQISIEKKDPYLIFTGVDCNFCDANPSIYIYSPSDGELITGSGKNSYGSPGRMFSYMNDSLLYESRIFFGQVLENRKGVIWYQNTLMETGKWEKSVFIAEIVDNKRIDRFLTDTTGLLEQTLSMFKKGLCKEIEGFDYTSEP